MITILRPEATRKYSGQFSWPKHLFPLALSNIVPHQRFFLTVTAVHEMILSNINHSNISTIRNWWRCSNVEWVSNNIMPIIFLACDFFPKNLVVQIDYRTVGTMCRLVCVFTIIFWQEVWNFKLKFLTRQKFEFQSNIRS